MIVPDYANAFSGLDAHERPIMTFGELMTFLTNADLGYVSAAAVYVALEEMCKCGSVWRLLRPGKVPLYALCRRIEFRARMRRQGCLSTYA